MSGKRAKSYAAIDAQLLATLAELPGYWLPAEDLAPCLGVSRIVVSRAALRLSAAGTIATRNSTWMAEKSRTRERSEFCYQPGASHRNRMPQWLEPTPHPIDPQYCRLIRGRQQRLFNEENSMTEGQINDLPPGVRTRFRELPDAMFADHPDVVEARARFEDIESQHREAAERHTKLRNQISGLQKQAQWARGEASRLADGRPRRLADILLSGDHDLAQDRAVLAQISDLLHFSEVVELVYPEDPNKRPASELAKRDAQAAAATRHIVSDLDGAAEHLRGVLDRLKLAEAERQWSS